MSRDEYHKILQEDRAREHWETYELMRHPLHVRGRLKISRTRLLLRGNPCPTDEEIQAECLVYEEEIFQRWLCLKKAKGFANFVLGHLPRER